MENELNGNCLACDLTKGDRDLPGGRIYETSAWVVEPCIGPLPIGTLIVKPLRHCVHVWELSEEEATQLGPLLRQVTAAISKILQPEQIYVCLWSHSGWRPGHLHFVLQPVWSDMQEEHEHPGPCLQSEMLHGSAEPPREEVEVFASEAQRIMQSPELPPANNRAPRQLR